MNRFIVCNRSKAGDRLDSGGGRLERVQKIQKLKVKREQRLGKGTREVKASK